eukprot:1344496-Lingulodinium_polyedra.AAC.1
MEEEDSEADADGGPREGVERSGQHAQSGAMTPEQAGILVPPTGQVVLQPEWGRCRVVLRASARR